MHVNQLSPINFGVNPSTVVKDFKQLPNVPHNHINDAKITLLKDEIASLQIEKNNLLETIRSFGAKYCSLESFYNKMANIEESIQKLQMQLDILVK